MLGQREGEINRHIVLVARHECESRTHGQGFAALRTYIRIAGHIKEGPIFLSLIARRPTFIIVIDYIESEGRSYG